MYTIGLGKGAIRNTAFPLSAVLPGQPRGTPVGFNQCNRYPCSANPKSPSSGFDCSGLVRWAYGRVGVDLPHSSYALYSEGRRVSQARMRAGDVLFFEGLGHVGLYAGRGRMVHAPQTGRTVEVVSLARTSYGSRLIGARRIAPA